MAPPNELFERGMSMTLVAEEPLFRLEVAALIQHSKSSTPAQEPEKVLNTPPSINYIQTPVAEHRGKPILAGYFGPTSFVSPLTDDVDLLAAEQGECEEEFTQRVLPVYWTEKVTEIVSSLGDFSLIGSLLHEYFDLCQSASLPAPLILNTIGPLTALCTERAHLEASENGAFSLTARIIQNTVQPFTVPPETVAGTFHRLFTGPAIRLEIIGVICSVAGRASKMGLASDKSKSRSSTVDLARRFIAASDAALQICKMLTPLNDLSIWLAHENLLLTDNLNWSSSPRCWNRLGELATDIFALGIHRESRKHDKVPQFLMETRRRVFAAAYQLDKSVATFLGRPTRIPLRYSDCSMPLDLPDDAFVSDQAQLKYGSSDLDPDNWNVRGVYRRASWLRVRFIVSTFREEILEVSLQNMTPHVVNVLNDISRRSRLAWEALPAHLQYTPQRWDTDHPLAARIMLSVSYLAHLYNDLLIQRLLAGRENPRGSPALLAVSSEILSSILAMDSQREQMAGLIRRDLMWTVSDSSPLSTKVFRPWTRCSESRVTNTNAHVSQILLYGFPSASLLVKALQHQKRTGEPLLYEGSRSALIRQLSVFVFHLETLARPNIPNYALFQRAAKIFSEIIDEVLEPHNSYPGIEGHMNDASFLEFDQILSADGLDLLDSLDCGVAYNQWLF
ncbi:hypothetical protein N7539_002090 [Penicillium diatomitis]|uniref:Xylanolytic transcriptional activator regulatory domain-containing protein n=1 Tax=Penicillium diatomitis TaxID=2819901 RepID=A0A9X0C0V0_9EURO|nr:uncharacterized protein N7539_002090 [Penicillium diatomitis]KAJ5493344.1 hypothetical protein N7539_002090 [Penicillium diatomitis]